MNMTREKLQGLESLNELAFTEEEASVMLSVFEEMADRESILASVDTEATEIMVHVMPMTNVLREDKRVQNFAREDLLNCGAERSEDSWIVPRLVK
ncbi:MAG: Asp-tRNA(Asn)/Glu-tRNA(Gln) amidotransferase subunit GatC [Oscillospiraceae bacterium]|nr:Asp-tRNA(Asn)/Glu-tRNA(Gln) amidotransferase subunit GatC [Oscillospiraceae bacterium]